MSRQINIHEAKINFSKLVDSVLNGEEIVITKSGKPAVKLIPFAMQKQRRFGVLKEKIEIAEDFDNPLS